jgi:hypothetical protein
LLLVIVELSVVGESHVIFERIFAALPIRSVSSADKKASGRSFVPSTHAGPV